MFAICGKSAGILSLRSPTKPCCTIRFTVAISWCMKYEKRFDDLNYNGYENSERDLENKHVHIQISEVDCCKMRFKADLTSFGSRRPSNKLCAIHLHGSPCF